MKGSKQTRSMGTLCRGMALDPPCSDALGTAWNKVQKNTPDHTLFFWTLLLDPPPRSKRKWVSRGLQPWFPGCWLLGLSPPWFLDLLLLDYWTFSPWLLGPSPRGFLDLLPLASWTFSLWFPGRAKGENVTNDCLSNSVLGIKGTRGKKCHQ